MPNRRQLLGASAALTASHSLSKVKLAHAQSTQSSEKTVKPLSILILGGTGFTGPHQVRYAVNRGHKVTVFNRGRRAKAGDWPQGVEELTGDRDTNDYASLNGRQWDVCIDNPTTLPHWVRDAAAVLKGNVKQYVFISTISVYTDSSKPNTDETAPREKYTGMDVMAETNATLKANMRLYGPLKAASEDEAHRQFRGMTTVIRPGLIVGPGDETDRFTYWPARLAKGGDVLVPPSADPVQFIDARDLAEWTIRMAEARTFGDFNGHGPAGVLTAGQMLTTIREAIGSNAVFKVATAKFLAEQKVNMWSDMPVWVPGEGETAGFHRRSNAKSIAASLSFRPLTVTAKDTLAWWQSQSETRRNAPKAGIKPEREVEVLALLAAALPKDVK
jgi:2'-hydroxyisoflavone reductase